MEGRRHFLIKRFATCGPWLPSSEVIWRPSGYKEFYLWPVMERRCRKSQGTFSRAAVSLVMTLHAIQEDNHLASSVLQFHKLIICKKSKETSTGRGKRSCERRNGRTVQFVDEEEHGL